MLGHINLEANDFKAQIDKYKLKNEGNAETKKEIANMMTKVSDDISSMPFEQTFSPSQLVNIHNKQPQKIRV